MSVKLSKHIYELTTEVVRKRFNDLILFIYRLINVFMVTVDDMLYL